MQRAGSPLPYLPPEGAADGSSGQQSQAVAPTGQNGQTQSSAGETRELHPLAPRGPPTTTDSTYVFWPGPAGRGRNAAANALANAVVGAGASGEDGPHGQLALTRQKTAQEVYGNITAPYDYTAGYHSLMKYLPHR